MTIRTNKQAIYAKTQTSADTSSDPDKSNLIPISSDITKTFLEDNSVERPELRGTFGANDSVIISETQAISIPTFIQGGGLSTKAVMNPPVRPLLEACFHKAEFFEKDGSTTESTEGDAIIQKYFPSDDDVQGATIIYQIDDIQQQMISARGTMSLSMEVGSFATMTFEMQSPYSAPTKTAAPTAGTVPTFQETLVVTGQSTLSVPGLPSQFANCVRSFSLSQNTTISAIDCATREGKRKISYVQTARAATGEIVVDMDEDTVASLAEVWGGKSTLSSKFSISSGAPSGLAVLGTAAGNQFVVASANYKIGAPTAGDSDGIATFTFPITFIPSGKAGEPDYELYYIGDAS